MDGFTLLGYITGWGKFATILIFQIGEPRPLPVQDFKWVRILILDVSVSLFLERDKLVLSLKKLRNTHNSQLHCLELDCKCSENWTRGGKTVCDLLLQISMKVRQSRTLRIKTRDPRPGRASESESVSCSVVSSNSLQPHGLEAVRLLCPRDSPGKNTGVGSHSLLQGIFLTQGLNLGLLHCRQILYHLSHPGRWRLQELPKPWFILWSDLQGRAP